MPKTKIVKSQYIDASIENVYEKISNLTHWSSWSPWLIMDPEAQVDIADDGKYYSWSGKRVGKGNMKVTSTVENKSVEFDLQFLTPFKSQANVGMSVETKNDGTFVTWTMDSSLPFYLFWMKKMMETYVGLDYERGLMLLKDYCEHGEIHSKLNWLGVSQFSGMHYLGLKTTCKLSDVDTHMKNDFEKLFEKLQNVEEIRFDKMFSIYHKFDPIKDIVEYTAGFGTTKRKEELGFISGELPPSKIYTIEHVGPYHHLGNAWSTFQNLIRGKEIKPLKNTHPWEMYLNDPQTTSPNNLVTQVNFVVK